MGARLHSSLMVGPRPPLALVVALTAGLAIQRLSVPGTQLPLLVPFVYGVIAVGLYRRVLSFDVARVRLYLVALVLVAVSTLTATLRGLTPSLSSALLLCGLYACGTVVLTAPTWEAYRTLLSAYVRVMTGFAGFGAALFVAQWAGLLYRDWVAAVVPDSMLLDGYYSSIALFFGSPYQRANGMVFLEPSFFSLFTGLAIAAALYLRAGLLSLSVLTVGLITSVSGNGMVVATAAVVVLVVSRQWRSLRPLAVPAVLALLAVVAFELSPILLGRLTEVTRSDSSASLRFVEPYGLFIGQLLESPATLLVGQGAGAADSLVGTVRASELVAPVAPKVLYEYGLITGLALLTTLLSMTMARVPTWVLGAGLALVYWIINPSLLVPVLPFTVFVFTTIWAPLRARPPVDRDPPGAEQAGGPAEESAVPAAVNSP